VEARLDSAGGRRRTGRAAAALSLAERLDSRARLLRGLEFIDARGMRAVLAGYRRLGSWSLDEAFGLDVASAGYALVALTAGLLGAAGAVAAGRSGRRGAGADPHAPGARLTAPTVSRLWAPIGALAVSAALSLRVAGLPPLKEARS
jgi:hypothetical protein